ncbi:hypothetical protein EV702DRAFT_365653 [Suillus placidus]|uniref:Uncharacterized protein n=1 Tax=Suillus placidus TaxID=48579 RepID=A0A9P6ZSS6_9AGAM|nr:hypothetical protein EV702DRAFT_365653 [Suillus placidus]
MILQDTVTASKASQPLLARQSSALVGSRTCAGPSCSNNLQLSAHERDVLASLSMGLGVSREDSFGMMETCDGCSKVLVRSALNAHIHDSTRGMWATSLIGLTYIYSSESFVLYATRWCLGDFGLRMFGFECYQMLEPNEAPSGNRAPHTR